MIRVSNFPKLSVRQDAGRLLLFVLVSFGASVVLTRAYLQATNYPTIGGNVLHFAHLLWGGLAMATAGIVLLVFATQRVHAVSAVLVGLGIGLFIDEVGKFITVNNDYFFRPAAPIIYICFLLVALIYSLVNRRSQSEERHLIAALEHVQSMVEATSSDETHAKLQEWLGALKRSSDPARAQLAVALAAYAEAQQRRDTIFSRAQRWLVHMSQRAQAFFERHIHVITIAVMILIGVRILTSFLVVLSVTLIDDNAVLDFISPDSNLGVVMDMVTGTLLLLGLVMYLARRRLAGLFWLQTAMVLSLTVVGVVTFYQAQFVAAINMLFDLAIWATLRDYAHRLQAAEAHHVPLPTDKSYIAPQPPAQAAR